MPLKNRALKRGHAREKSQSEKKGAYRRIRYGLQIELIREPRTAD